MPAAALAPTERRLGAARAAAHMAHGDGGEAAVVRRSTNALGSRTLAPAPGRHQPFRQRAPTSGNSDQRARAAAQGGAIVPWTDAPAADFGGADQGVGLTAPTTPASGCGRCTRPLKLCSDFMQ